MDFQKVKKDKVNSLFIMPDGRNSRIRMVVLWTHQDHQQSAKDYECRKQVLGKGLRADCARKCVVETSKGRNFLTGKVVVLPFSFCIQKLVLIF